MPEIGTMPRDVSPLAQRIARLSGLDLDTLAVTGAEGRIRARDVLALLSDTSSAKGAAGAPGNGGPRTPTGEGSVSLICLETPCDAMPLFNLAHGDGEGLPKVPFKHALVFMVVHALARTPGMVPSRDREAGPTVRIRLSADGGWQGTLAWNTCSRHILPLSRALCRLEAAADPKSEVKSGENNPHILVILSTISGVRDRSAAMAGLPMPVLNVRYCEPTGTADLTLTWHRHFGDHAKAVGFLSELKRLIEEPRRLLL